jgi:MFS family permease
MRPAGRVESLMSRNRSENRLNDGRERRTLGADEQHFATTTHPDAAMSDAKPFYGWKLVGALWGIILVNMAFPSYGAGVINAAMARDLNFDRATLGLGFTVFMIAAALASPLIARLVNSAGARLTLFCGSMFIALGALLLASWAHEGWQYVLAFGLLVGTGCATGSLIPAQTCATLWFERRRALALSIVLTGSGAGGFIAPPLLAHVIGAAHGNWRAGWYFVLAAALAAGCAALVFVRNRPSDDGQVPDGTRAGQTLRDARGDARSDRPSSAIPVFRTRDRWSLREAMETRSIWLISLAAFGVIAPTNSVLSQGIPHLRDLGHSANQAAAAIAVLALCSIVGKLGAGFLCDRLEPRYVWVASLALTASGLWVATEAQSVQTMYSFVILLGIGYGATMTCWPAMVANYFGPASFASVLGVQLPLVNLLAAAGPYLFGVVHDSRGTYSLAFYATSAVAVVTALLLLAATPPRHDREPVAVLPVATNLSGTAR